QPHTNGPVGDLDGVTGVGVGDGLVDAGGLGGVGHGELHGGLLVWGERAGCVTALVGREQQDWCSHASIAPNVFHVPGDPATTQTRPITPDAAGVMVSTTS